MKGSLQDQLLKAGLANKGAAKQARAEKRKRQKQNKKAAPELTEAQVAAEKAAAEKREKDKALNQLQQEERAKKELQAQIKQLIEVNQQPVEKGETLLNFTDNNVVKRMYVTEAMHKLVIDARIAVVKFNDDYALVPVPVADKIAERDASHVVFRADDRVENEAKSEEDDWYADFEIPDDLMW